MQHVWPTHTSLTETLGSVSVKGALIPWRNSGMAVFWWPWNVVVGATREMDCHFSGIMETCSDSTECLDVTATGQVGAGTLMGRRARVTIRILWPQHCHHWWWLKNQWSIAFGGTGTFWIVWAKTWFHAPPRTSWWPVTKVIDLSPFTSPEPLSTEGELCPFGISHCCFYKSVPKNLSLSSPQWDTSHLPEWLYIVEWKFSALLSITRHGSWLMIIIWGTQNTIVALGQNETWWWPDDEFPSLLPWSSSHCLCVHFVITGPALKCSPCWNSMLAFCLVLPRNTWEMRK